MRSPIAQWPKAAVAAAAATAVIAAGAAPALAGSPAQGSQPVAADRIALTETVDTTELAEATAARVYGDNRYETAAEVARSFEQDIDVVYLASGVDFPDALAARAWGDAAPVSTEADGLWPQSHAEGLPAPVLLTQRNHLPSATAEVIAELQPSEIRIVGGTPAISAAVQARVEAEFPAATVTRLGGDHRYETAALIAAQFPSPTPVAFVVTGENYPDALAAGAVAGRAHAPVLLTRANHLPNATRAALTGLGVEEIIVVGGDGVVSDDVLAELAGIAGSAIRIAGEDRYETAALLADAYERDAGVVLATGINFPDALAGSALAAQAGAPILLTPGTSLGNVTGSALDALSPSGVVIVGSDQAVPAAAEATVNEWLPLWVDEVVVQVLGFNDYHGHLEAASDARLPAFSDPDQNLVGGVEYLSTWLQVLRTRAYDDQTITVAVGDLVGGSPFLSGMFNDEPSIESLNALGLELSVTGNHEYDRGLAELTRIVEGGCLEAGCFFPDEPYTGTDFEYLAANVVYEETGEPHLPPYAVRTLAGVEVGFIGINTTETPSLVSPGGVADLDFLDEVETANAYAAELTAAGVDAIVVLVHDGGAVNGTYNSCDNLSGPIVDIVGGLDDSIDAVLSAHTHHAYVCSLENAAGNEITVTSAREYGRVITELELRVSQSAGEVLRERTGAVNQLVTRDVAPDPVLTEIVQKWQVLGEEYGNRVVGTITEDITGDASTNRDTETALGNLIADAILWGTETDAGGNAEIAFMNIGGIRADLIYEPSGDEAPGEVTYAEAFAVAPFGNILVTFDLTGADIEAVLEQQYIESRGRQYLHLATSEGLTYTWDKGAPEGEQISDLQLNGVAIDPDATYRVATLSFLAEGGDQFTAFTNGTNLVGGPGDLTNLVDFFEANPGLDAPAIDRVNEIPAP